MSSRPFGYYIYMDAETFNLVVSITLIILTVGVLIVLFIVARIAISIARFITRLESRAEKLYSRAVNIESKIAVGAWFWPKFIRSIISSDFVKSVWGGRRDRKREY